MISEHSKPIIKLKIQELVQKKNTYAFSSTLILFLVFTYFHFFYRLKKSYFWFKIKICICFLFLVIIIIVVVVYSLFPLFKYKKWCIIDFKGLISDCMQNLNNLYFPDFYKLKKYWNIILPNEIRFSNELIPIGPHYFISFCTKHKHSRISMNLPNIC